MNFSHDCYPIGYWYVVPVFLYTHLVYGIFRQNVVVRTSLGGLLNLVGCMALVPWLGIKRALVWGKAMQWVILWLFVYREKTGCSPKRRAFSFV